MNKNKAFSEIIKDIMDIETTNNCNICNNKFDDLIYSNGFMLCKKCNETFQQNKKKEKQKLNYNTLLSQLPKRYKDSDFNSFQTPTENL